MRKSLIAELALAAAIPNSVVALTVILRATCL